MLVRALWLAVLFMASNGKRCCDEHCRRPISYGRTVERHIAGPQTRGSVPFLSFAQGSLVQVFAKEVAGEEEEYWEAEVSGRRGLVPRASIAEQHVVCHSPGHVLEDPPELASLVGDKSDDSPAWDGGQAGLEEGGTTTEGGSPTEGRAPTEGEAPTEGGATTEGGAPTDREAQTEGEAPIEDEAPTEGGAPTEDAARVSVEGMLGHGTSESGGQPPKEEEGHTHAAPDRGVPPAREDQAANIDTQGVDDMGKVPPEVTEGNSPSEAGEVRNVDHPPPSAPVTPDGSVGDRQGKQQPLPVPHSEGGSADSAGMENGKVVAEEVVVSVDTVLTNSAASGWQALPGRDGIPETFSASGPVQLVSDSGKTSTEEWVEDSARGTFGPGEELKEENSKEEDEGHGEEKEEGEGHGEEEEGEEEEQEEQEEEEEEEEKEEEEEGNDNEDQQVRDENHQNGWDKQGLDRGNLHRNGGDPNQDGSQHNQDGGEQSQDGSERNQDGGKRSQDEGERNQGGGQHNQDWGQHYENWAAHHPGGDEHSQYRSEHGQDGGERGQDGGERGQDGGERGQDGGEQSQDGGEQSQDGGERNQGGGERYDNLVKQHPKEGEHGHGEYQTGGKYHEHEGGGDEDKERREGELVLDKDSGHSDMGEQEQAPVDVLSARHSLDHARSVEEEEGTAPTTPTEANFAAPPVPLTASNEDRGWDTLAEEKVFVQPTEQQSSSSDLPQEPVTLDDMGDTADDIVPGQDDTVEYTVSHPLQGEYPTPLHPSTLSTDDPSDPIHNTVPPSDTPTAPLNQWVELGQPTVEVRRKAAGGPTEPSSGIPFHSKTVVEVAEDEDKGEESPGDHLVNEDGAQPDSLAERLLLYLPHPLRGMLEAQFGPGGMVGMLYGVVGTLVALVVPSCLLCCQSCSSRRKHTQAVQQHKASKQQLQQQLDATVKEKGELSSQLEAEKAQCSSAEHQLANFRQTVAGLEQERGSLMEHISTLKHALTEVNGDLQATRENSSQLAASLAQEQTRSQSLEVQVASLGQELIAASGNQQKSEGRVAELEAAKDQMEQDLFNSQQALQTLQQSERKLTAQCDLLQHSVQGVSDELQESQREAFHLRQAVQDKDTELEMLRNCLRQLTPEEGEAEGQGERDGEEEGTAGSEGEAAPKHQSRVEKIHAMLDTSKAQLELKSVKEEREKLDRDLQLERTARLGSEAEVQRLEQELQALSAERDAMTLQRQQTLSKLQTLTEYFESKEQNLHRRLGREEMARQEMEGREASAKDLVMAAEEERTREKEELKALRKQMAEIEKSMTEQLFTNQQRAQEAYSQLKRREQELRAANKEITALKQSLDEADAQIAALSRPRTPPRFPPFGRPPPPHGRPPLDDFDGPPRPLGPPPPHARPRPPSVGPLPQDRHPPGVRGLLRPSSTQPRTSSPGGPEEDLSVSHVSAPGSGGPPSRSRSPNSIAGEMPSRTPSGRLSMPEFMDQPPVGARSGPTYPAGMYRGPPPGIPRGEYPPYAPAVRPPVGRGSFPPPPFGPPPGSRGPPPGSYPDKPAQDNFVRAPPISAQQPRQTAPPLTHPQAVGPSPPWERRLPPPDHTGRPPLRDVYPPPDQTGRPPLRDVYLPPDQTGRPPLRDVYPPPDQTGRPPLHDVYPPPDQTGRPPPRDVYPPPDQTGRPPLRDVYPPPDQTGRPPLRDVYPPPGNTLAAGPPVEGPPPPHLAGSTSAAAEQGFQSRNV